MEGRGQRFVGFAGTVTSAEDARLFSVPAVGGAGTQLLWREDVNRSCGRTWAPLFSLAFPIIVNTRVDSDPRRLSQRQRLSLGACGAGLAGLLLVAASLHPNPAGLGTHEQLGLPPCTFRWLFGIRCPSCGMTTSWSHATHGQWRQALAANVGGTLLAALALAVAPLCVISAVRGRWLIAFPSDWALAAGALVLAAMTLLDWAIRLATG